MPSARPTRRTRYIASKQRDKKSVSKGKLSGIFKIILLPLLFLLFYLFILVTSEAWNGKDRFSVTYPKTGGDVEVTVFDPSLSEITTMVIPGDTEVSVAGNYGTLRLKNVWQLGINEKKYGSILAKTVTKNFLFPVYLWGDTDTVNLTEGGVSGAAKFVFFPSKTNLTFGDRFRIALFTLRVKNIDRSIIDMAKNQFVKKSILSDGEQGFIAGEASGRLTVYFSDNDFVDENGQALRIYIVDRSGTTSHSQKMGEILEVLGGKIISVDRSQSVDERSCEVKGKGKGSLKKVKNIFDCKVSEEATDYDLEITIGKNFPGNF
jgi:hypothetical protein